MKSPEEPITRREALEFLFVGGALTVFVLDDLTAITPGSIIQGLSANMSIVPFSMPTIISGNYTKAALSDQITYRTLQRITSEVQAKTPDSVGDLIFLAKDAAAKSGARGKTNEFRTGLLALAAIGTQELNPPLKKFPDYIYGGRPTEPGIDKTVHLLVATYIAFELRRLQSLGKNDKAEELKRSVYTAKGLVGWDNLAKVKRALSETDHWSSRIGFGLQGFNDKEKGVIETLSDAAVIFEIFTTSSPSQQFTSNFQISALTALEFQIDKLTLNSQAIDQAIAQALSTPVNPNINHGLVDPESNLDVLSGLTGAALGVMIFGDCDNPQHPSRIPDLLRHIPFSDRKFPLQNIRGLARQGSRLVAF